MNDVLSVEQLMHWLQVAPNLFCAHKECLVKILVYWNSKLFTTNLHNYKLQFLLIFLHLSHNNLTLRSAIIIAHLYEYVWQYPISIWKEIKAVSGFTALQNARLTLAARKSRGCCYPASDSCFSKEIDNCGYCLAESLAGKNKKPVILSKEYAVYCHAEKFTWD